MSIHVQLERFEGPLGLLLHLIREQEMDVFNINIHHITRQYLEYIKAMRRLDLEVAGEFVAMAATLLHIKSRMLLPQYTEDGEEAPEDPRKELVQKLVEYKKIQELSGELYKRPLLGRDVLVRGERENVEPEVESELVLADNPLFSLISAYRLAMKNVKKTVHKVSSELQSIASRILEMKDLLVVGQRVIFTQFLTKVDETGNHVLVTFLSILELAKMGFISVFQNEPLSEIHVEAKRAVDRDVVSQAENYESVNADQLAEEIINEAALSLNEPVAEFEGEEAPVVAEGFADAASDEDIEAEERRLFAEGDGAFDAAAPVTGHTEASVADQPSALGTGEVAVSAETDAVKAFADQLGEPAINDAAAPVTGHTGIFEPADTPISLAEHAEHSLTSEVADDAPITAEIFGATADASINLAEHPEHALTFEDGASVSTQVDQIVDVATEEIAMSSETDAIEAIADQLTAPAIASATAGLAAALSAFDEPVAPAAPPPATEPAREDISEELAKQQLSTALSAAISAFDAFEEITPESPNRESEVES